MVMEMVQLDNHRYQITLSTTMVVKILLPKPSGSTSTGGDANKGYFNTYGVGFQQDYSIQQAFYK